jgi:hypothetical protein
MVSKGLIFSVLLPLACGPLKEQEASFVLEENVAQIVILEPGTSWPPREGTRGGQEAPKFTIKCRNVGAGAQKFFAADLTAARCV